MQLPINGCEHLSMVRIEQVMVAAKNIKTNSITAANKVDPDQIPLMGRMVLASIVCNPR